MSLAPHKAQRQRPSLAFCADSLCAAACSPVIIIRVARYRPPYSPWERVCAVHWLVAYNDGIGRLQGHHRPILGHIRGISMHRWLRFPARIEFPEATTVPTHPTELWPTVRFGLEHAATVRTYPHSLVHNSSLRPSIRFTASSFTSRPSFMVKHR